MQFAIALTPPKFGLNSLSRGLSPSSLKRMFNAGYPSISPNPLVLTISSLGRTNLFMTIAWMIWNRCNSFIFLGNLPSHECAYAAILCFVNQIIYATTNSFPQQCPSHYQLVNISWQTPLMRWVKLNTDGAAKGTPGEASSARLFCNALGQWIRGFAFCIGIDFVLTAEFKAILSGLQIAWECGFKHLIIDCDSLTAIFMIRNPNTSHPMFGRILKSISHWLY